jgi:hypothetical protein
MDVRRWIVTALMFSLAGPTLSHAAPSGVQWTLDSARILVNKDVGNERWAITLNVLDFSASGNVFRTDDAPPGFIWCQKNGESFDSSVGELNLSYSCYGSAAGLGGFAESDWNLISDNVVLPLSFFIPDTETCDLRDALNGSNSASSGTFWSCGGSEGSFDFQVFANGTAFSSATGAFTYDAVSDACRVEQLDDGSYLDLEYSPSRDHLTLYETTTDVKELIISECERKDF